MSKTFKRYTITSALPYANGPIHIGHLAGVYVPADIYARYLRMKGEDVVFIGGSDEHGVPITIKARQEGISPQDVVDKYHNIIRDSFQEFGISFDVYSRTSSPLHHETASAFFKKLYDAGGFIEKETEQYFDEETGQFLADRYITGTCPHCSFERAYGDQCENCTKQLDPTDLINPRSAISGSTDLEVRETKHLFLRQSALRERLDQWIDSQKGWPVLTTSIARKWLHDGDGLQDRGITRDLDWGVPVKDGERDWPGMEGKVFYVWFDAPIEYIAATAEWAEAQGLDDAAWRRWWRTDEGAGDVRYIQFMGKDNVPFHTLSFPATLMGSAEPWKMVDYIKSFNYLNYDGGQFSTSQGRGVFMDQALGLLPADYWRWWLLSHAPESSDSEFTWENFQASVNKDLADVLGNLVSRVTKFCRSKFGEVVPEGGEWGAREAALMAALDTRIRAYEGFMEAMEVRKSAGELRAIWVLGNEYLQEAAPWSSFKTDPALAAAQVRLALNLIRLYAVLSRPFIPDAAGAMMASLGCDDWRWPDDVAAALNLLPPGHGFTVPEVMFAKITDEARAEWAERFAGGRG